MAQSCHVVFSFSQDHPEETKRWMSISNYIAVLNSSGEPDLHQLIELSDRQGIKYSIFREPDIGDQITAIAFEPGSKSKKLCSHLKLALK